MGTYQGQATLVLSDGTRIDGQAQVRTRARSWEGRLAVGPEEALERAGEATHVELPGGESRTVTVTTTPEYDSDTRSYFVTFESTD